jgi:acyl-CoA thioesterase I
MKGRRLGLILSIPFLLAVWISANFSMQANAQGGLLGDILDLPGGKPDPPKFPINTTKIEKGDVRVACVGDASTWGAGLNNRDDRSYPAELDALLGAGWEVKNFGREGATLQSAGDLPYTSTSAFDAVKIYQPDVVLIALGREDTKPWNWSGEERFKESYRELVATLQSLDSAPQVMLCLPPATPKQSGAVNRDGILKCLEPIREVAAELDLQLIDFHSPLSGRTDVFQDSGDPDKRGAKELAEIAEVPLRVVEAEQKAKKQD